MSAEQATGWIETVATAVLDARAKTRTPVSLLTAEALAAAPIGSAALGETLRTRGIDLMSLPLGRRLRVGSAVVLQVTEHSRVARDVTEAEIVWTLARVLKGGRVVRGDTIATDPDLDRPRFAVVTLSDRSAAGAHVDESGPLAAALLRDSLGTEPLTLDILPDDRALLEQHLIALADDELVDLIVTTGGTGLSPRDTTPEATLAVIDREVPGIAEAIRIGGLAKTPLAMLSRAVCGQRGATLIVNLSGSPKAVREQLAILMPVLGHVLTTARGLPQSCGPVTPTQPG